jgi:maltose alpha-D-glucosyltransferase/alpha-amylase
MDNDRRLIELVHAMLFSLPGSPILYYGDEIGMGDNIWLEDRNGVRTPMQWDHSQPHAGFSTAKTIYAPVINSPDYNPLKVNVKDSAKDPSSLYNMLSFMIATRRKHSCFGFGNLFVLSEVDLKSPGKLLWIDNKLPCIASWARYHGGSKSEFCELNIAY